MDTVVLFSEAYAQLRSHARKLFPILAIPLLVVMLSDHLYLWATSNVVVEITVTLLGLFFYIAIAIIVHRTILIGEDAIRPSEVLVPRTRVFVYLFFFIGICLVMIPLMVLAFIPFVGQILIPIGCAYLFSRFCLILPAIAIDHSPSFGDSWRMTHNHQFTMFCSIGIFPMLASYVERYAYLVPHVGVWVGSVLSAFLIVYTTAIISVAYERLHD